MTESQRKNAECQRKMPDREKVIESLEICAAGTNSCNKCPMKDKCHGVSNAAMVAAIKLLKEQDKIEEQLIEAFKTIRNAYNVPANREKILLNYLLRIERAVKRDA